MRLFSIVRLSHPNCSDCEATASKAAAVARATGSVISAYAAGPHGSRVERVNRKANS